MAIKIPRVQTSDRLINQLQQNIIGEIEPIFGNLSGSFLVTLTGCTTSPQRTVYWQRSTSTGPVTLIMPAISATSNTAAATLTGLPAGFWPSVAQTMLLRVTDNGTTAVGLLNIDTTGVMTLYASAAAAAFTASGTKGVALSTVTYGITI